MPDEQQTPTPTEEEKAQIASRNLASAQTLTTIALIASPVSLIIGGVLLSGAALICALVAQSKVRMALLLMDEPTFMASRLRTQTRIAVFVSLGAMVANVVYPSCRDALVRCATLRFQCRADEASGAKAPDAYQAPSG